MSKYHTYTCADSTAFGQIFQQAYRLLFYGAYLGCKSSIVIGLLLSGLSAECEEVKPMIVGGDLIHVACVRQGAPLFKEADKQTIITNVPWMTPYVVIEKKEDPASSGLIKVGKFISIDRAETQGWMEGNDLVMRQEAIKNSGIFEKAIVVVHFDKERKVIGGAAVRDTPRESASSVGQELTLFNIYHVYDKREDFKANKVFWLLGNEPRILDPQKPGQTIIGWADESELFGWNTREAAEYNKSSGNNRQPVRIYEHEVELAAILSGKQTPNDVQPLATEDLGKTEVLHTDPRFPIIDKEREVQGHKMWNIGFVADEIGGPGGAEREKVASLSRIPNVVDIVFVFDGTGSMKQYKDAVAGAVKKVQEAAVNYWKEHYPGETQAEIRFSITMYKDYPEKVHYKRLPLEKDNAAKIQDFVDKHDYSGGIDEPAVFNGISTTLNDIDRELSDSSFRAIFLIGDMGNLGKSDKADPKGHTIEKIVGQLKARQIDFYAIHVASEQKEDSFRKFERQVKEIKKNLAEGFAEYIPLTSTAKVQSEIYERVIQLLDERYRLPQLFTDVATGRIQLGKQISGTRLEQRAIEIMKRHKLDPQDFVRVGASAFAKGWVAPFDAASGKRAIKPVVLMNKVEVETLIALLGRMTQVVNAQNVKQGWIEALENVLGEDIKTAGGDVVVPGDVIQKHLGIPVKSGVLNMSFDEIGKLPAARVTEAIKDFKKKLFLLRAVVNEKEIEIGQDAQGEPNFTPKGNKSYWFGSRGNERVWLDMEFYLP